MDFKEYIAYFFMIIVMFVALCAAAKAEDQTYTIITGETYELYFVRDYGDQTVVTDEYGNMTIYQKTGEKEYFKLDAEKAVDYEW